MIEELHMVFNGRIDVGAKCISMCCENVDNRPGVELKDTAEKTIMDFVKKRADIITESIQHSLLSSVEHKENIHTIGCNSCSNYQLRNWGVGSDRLIHYINMSAYPAPCQCKCFYCGYYNDGDVYNNEVKNCDNGFHDEWYDKMFNAIEWADKNGLISKNARWQVSCGEIGIHPYKERILKLVKNRRSFFLLTVSHVTMK